MNHFQATNEILFQLPNKNKFYPESFFNEYIEKNKTSVFPLNYSG